MDLAGWIQVLSIIGALIVILGFYGKIVRESTKTKAAADKANTRLDNIEDNNKTREESCPMRKTIKDYGDRLKTVEGENKKAAIDIASMQTDLTNIKSSVDEVKGDVKRILTAVSK